MNSNTPLIASSDSNPSTNSDHMNIHCEPRHYDFTSNKGYYMAAASLLHNISVLDFLNELESFFTLIPLHLCLFQAKLRSFIESSMFYDHNDIFSPTYSIDDFLPQTIDRSDFDFSTTSSSMIATKYLLVFVDHQEIHLRIPDSRRPHTLLTLDFRIFSLIIRFIYILDSTITYGNDFFLTDYQNLFEHILIIHQHFCEHDTLAIHPFLLLRRNPYLQHDWQFNLIDLATSEFSISLLPALSTRRFYNSDIPLFLPDLSPFFRETSTMKLLRYDKSFSHSRTNAYDSMIFSITYYIGNYKILTPNVSGRKLSPTSKPQLPSEVIDRILQYTTLFTVLDCQCRHTRIDATFEPPRSQIYLYPLSFSITTNNSIDLSFLATFRDDDIQTNRTPSISRPRNFKATLALSSSHLRSHNTATQPHYDRIEPYCINRSSLDEDKNLLSNGILYPLKPCSNDGSADSQAPTLSKALSLPTRGFRS